MVIKKDGRREAFAKEKILKGLQAACQKRPISLSQLDNVVERISNWVLQRKDKEISALLIGQKLMQELRQLDDVAYIRFASVYRNFKDVQEFVETLEDEDDSITKPVPKTDSMAEGSLDNSNRTAQLASTLSATIKLEKDAHETSSTRDCPTDSISN